MNKIKLLDCTLRDGGYCNEWRFGFSNINKIISGLVESDIDIIECGFLTNQTPYQTDVTKFTTVKELATVIPTNKKQQIFVAMVNYGEYDIMDLPQRSNESIDGIRVAFHKEECTEALEFCKAIKEKGYLVFIQAMVSLSYSDEEFLEMINISNSFEPFAFYIVDSFGMMKQKDLIRLFYMIEHNLKESIWIGFHSHNNMQLAYSNAQTLVNIQTTRNLIIDSSIYGMGRGAGNLNTELFVEYLNENNSTEYKLRPLLNIIDEILNDFYLKNYWGYSLPNYLSASHNVHPNYASYLDAKKTLTVEDMNEIFSIITPENKYEFDQKYIENLYIQYLAAGRVHEEHLAELRHSLTAKKVLIIAPGKSSLDEKDKILEFANRKDVITISVNFEYDDSITDYIFISNLRRFRELDKNKHSKCITTSNIPFWETYLQTNYKDLINDIEFVRDNASLMLIKFLVSLGVADIFLAGVDGYSAIIEENYADEKMNFIVQKATFQAMNKGMCIFLEDYANKKDLSITFLTPPRHVFIKKD